VCILWLSLWQHYPFIKIDCQPHPWSIAEPHYHSNMTYIILNPQLERHQVELDIYILEHQVQQATSRKTPSHQQPISIQLPAANMKLLTVVALVVSICTLAFAWPGLHHHVSEDDAARMKKPMHTTALMAGEAWALTERARSATRTHAFSKATLSLSLDPSELFEL
jgi:hypothetical protein